MGSSYPTIRNIIKLGRLRFLWLGFSLYLLGALLALASGAAFGFDRFVFGYIVLMTGHLSVHYSNDYFDYEVDSKTVAGALSGGSGILPRHPELLGVARGLGIALAAASVLLAVAFVLFYRFPWYYLGFAIFGNLLSWYYTAPPVRLAYRGLGEIATMIAVGFLMPGIGDFSTFGTFSPAFLAFAVPLLLYSLSFILNVEVPDMEGDAACGKHTFVAHRGRGFAFVMIGAMALLATAYLAVLALAPAPFDLRPAFAFSLAPLAPALYGMVKQPCDREEAVKLVKVNVGCFLLIILLMDAYLLFIHL